VAVSAFIESSKCCNLSGYYLKSENDRIEIIGNYYKNGDTLPGSPKVIAALYDKDKNLLSLERGTISSTSFSISIPNFAAYNPDSYKLLIGPTRRFFKQIKGKAESSKYFAISDLGIDKGSLSGITRKNIDIMDSNTVSVYLVIYDINNAITSIIEEMA
jgi:hypothetical protein